MTITLRPLAEQVVVVTGASSGIGLVTARAFAAKGAKVMLVARNRVALAEAVAGIEAAGGTAAFAVADVGVLAQVQAAADAAVARFGRIDTWVNNAGVAIYAPLLDTPMDEHERLFRTNYFGVVHGALAAMPLLRGRGGAFVTVASIVADIPTPVMGAYAASKHAVKGYVGSLRIEARNAGWPVAITLVKPSGIGTPIADHAANHLAGAARIPPPAYDPALVAAAILDAATHPRREVTVGGVGLIQTLVAEHFPALLDRLGGKLTPFLHDPAAPEEERDNLDAPVDGGRERSAVQPGRRVSLWAWRRPVAMAGGVVAAGLLLRASRVRSR